MKKTYINPSIKVDEADVMVNVLANSQPIPKNKGTKTFNAKGRSGLYNGFEEYFEETEAEESEW